MSDIIATNLDQTNREEHWVTHIKQWKESKLSQPDYCRQADIVYSSFVYWRSKFSSETKASQKNT